MDCKVFSTVVEGSGPVDSGMGPKFTTVTGKPEPRTQAYTGSKLFSDFRKCPVLYLTPSVINNVVFPFFSFSRFPFPSTLFQASFGPFSKVLKKRVVSVRPSRDKDVGPRHYCGCFTTNGTFEF